MTCIHSYFQNYGRKSWSDGHITLKTMSSGSVAIVTVWNPDQSSFCMVQVGHRTVASPARPLPCNDEASCTKGVTTIYVSAQTMVRSLNGLVETKRHKGHLENNKEAYKNAWNKTGSRSLSISLPFSHLPSWYDFTFITSALDFTHPPWSHS